MHSVRMKLQSWNNSSATFIADPEPGERIEIRSLKIARGAWEAGGRLERIVVNTYEWKEPKP